MDKLKCWMEKNKQLCVLTGILGMLLAPFMWPFFLAIIFNSLTLVIPVLLVYMLIKQPWKEKNFFENNKCNESKEKSDKKSETEMEHKNASDKENQEIDHLSEAEQKKKQEAVDPPKRENAQSKNDAGTQKVLAWYRMEGRERIFRMKSKLSQEGINQFSVNKEGICTVREEKRFRRIGVIKSFPQKAIFKIERELQADGICIKSSGKYLWLSWGKEVHH